MRLWPAVISVAALSIVATPAFSFEENEAHNMISSDFSVCTAYFFLASRVFSDDENKMNRWVELAEYSWEKAQAAGRNAGILEETVTARVEITMKQFASRMDDNGANVDIISNALAVPCRELVEKEGERFQFWLDQSTVTGNGIWPNSGL